MKNSDAIKNKKKNHQIVVSHHILTYPQLYTHMYTPTHKKTSSLIIINVINQSINTIPKLSIFFSHRPHFRLECLSIS